MEVNAIKDAFERVAKKQKLTYSKSQEVIDQVTLEIQSSLEKLHQTQQQQPDPKPVLSDLKTKIKEVGPLSQLEATQKDLNISINKYTKLLDKSFNPDISKAYRNIDPDTPIINQIIASHFYRQGLFEVGDSFASEATMEDAGAIKSPYVEMYQILEAMKNRDLGPALSWAAMNSSKLNTNESNSNLLLKLHRMQFVEIVQNGSREEALKYAKTKLSPFASIHLGEIQKLMACLLWSNKLDQSPYSELLSSTHWDKLSQEVATQFCNLLGQSYQSPLEVTVSAGVKALPPLLKFITVMAGKKHEYQTMKQLPIPVELEDRFQFHSIFVCPVSKEQASEDNPPMLMSCGHVLCKQSIMKMSKNLSKSFKCPYCPTDVDASHCKQLNF